MSTLAEVNNNIDQQEQYLRSLTKTFTGIEKPLKHFKPVETLSELISELHKVFDSDRVNIEYVNHLMLSYKSNPAEWKKFAKFDRYRYTRNLVDAGNGKFNLMILCWGEGHGSAIHDHADSHCFMKILRGELQEVRYAWPTNGATTEQLPTGDIGSNDEHMTEYDGEELQEISRSTVETDSVCYINDTLGLHRVENPSHSESAVSLHLYCPPFNACSIFNKKTGKRTSCNVTFWSKFGEKRDKTATTTASPEDN
ncbi:Cysteine dioxygenase type 1 [Pseudolycoriella hygida]|uniref:Cysteine dioxygenase n=1 Tax=Pseudolycoriella hygida TaxID=35572 RepID=A0A9Q0N1K6_9DIPT|nr:Cysteine dioxygenase type 1 [Pseudolycoriella hygida]